MAEHQILEALSGVAPGVSEPTNRTQQTILYVNPHASSECILIRVLLGSCDFESSRYGLQWEQNEDFSILGVQTRPFNTRKQFQSYLTTNGIPFKKLDEHLRRNLTKEGFYKEIAVEVILALIRRKKGEHTLAFLHIYRFLERISFAFPVIYAASSTDFKATYTTLKEYLVGGTDKGELAFFKKFLDVAIDPVLTSAVAKLSLTDLDTGDRGSVFSVLKKFIPPTAILSETPDQAIEIPYSEVMDLLVNLRNRFFHFTSNHTGNISSLDLPVSDHLFGCVNDVFLNWLAAIYFEILRKIIVR